MSEPVWISKQLVERIHELQLMEHGGEEGYLNEGHLDAAIARPRMTYGYLPDTSLEELAASLAVGIVKGHAFVDGNKRTACVAALTFLSMNGIEIQAGYPETAEVFENITKKTMSESDLALWFEERALPDE